MIPGTYRPTMLHNAFLLHLQRVLVSPAFFVFFAVVIMLMVLRGTPGNPDLSNPQQIKDWTSLEQRSRFTLLYSLAEHGTVHYRWPVAWASQPDLGYLNGHYVSLVNPGASFLFLPAYLVGKLIGSSQLTTVFFNALVAVANGFLIRLILLKLRVSLPFATLAGFIFLFATPAFSFASTFFSHHLSAFCLLGGIYALLQRHPAWRLLFWYLFGLAILIDIPNFFLMLPLAVWGIEQNWRAGWKYNLASLSALVVPLLVLALFNYYSYGSPWRLPAMVPNATVGVQGQTTMVTTHEKKPVRFFASQYLIENLHIQFFRRDRGMLVFTPVAAVGLLGLLAAMTRKRSEEREVFYLLVASALFTISLYALYFDSAAGWSFGFRYHIPLFGLCLIGLGAAWSKWGNRPWFFLPVIFATFYSLVVNLSGALTHYLNFPEENFAIPDYAQQAPTVSPEGHLLASYLRNFYFIEKNSSTSFFYNHSLASHVSLISYYGFLLVLMAIIFILLFQASVRNVSSSHTSTSPQK